MLCLPRIVHGDRSFIHSLSNAELAPLGQASRHYHTFENFGCAGSTGYLTYAALDAKKIRTAFYDIPCRDIRREQAVKGS